MSNPETNATGRAMDDRPTMKFHPVADDYADLTPDELAAFSTDVKTNGLIQPIVVWRGEIVDGKHRYLICQNLGVEPKMHDITDECPTEEAMRARVRSLNEHRRSRTTPLSNDEKRRRTMEELAKDPNRSDRAIAEVVGVHNETVAAHRQNLEVTESVTCMNLVSAVSPAEHGPVATCSNERVGRHGYGTKRQKIEAALRADPTKSNVEIAKSLGESHNYVSEVRIKIGLGNPHPHSQRTKDEIAKRAKQATRDSKSGTLTVSRSVSKFANNGKREDVTSSPAPTDATTPSRPQTKRSNPIIRAWDNSNLGQRSEAIGHLRKIGAVR